MASPENTGLPIVSGDELVGASLYSNPIIAPQDQSYFIRRVGINQALARYVQYHGLGLKDILDVADERFDNFAKRCGGTVIEHEWCFAPYDRPVHPHAILDQFPKGHGLAARVPVLHQTRSLKRSQKRLIEFVSRIEEMSQDTRWRDPGTHQFTHGFPVKDLALPNPPKPSLWLHDIDLYLYCR